MKRELLLSAAAAATAWGGAASANPIIFEEFAPGTPITNQYAGQGVALFSSVGGDPTISGASGWPPPVMGQGLLGFQAAGGIQPVRADFVVAATMVEIDGGDLSGDDDDVFLEAYSAGDVLLDMDNIFLMGPVSGTLSVSSNTPIAYVIFYSNSTINGSSTVWDNLRWTEVPGPGALALFACGGIVTARRRR